MGTLGVALVAATFAFALTDSSPRRVAVVGDSITYFSEPAISAALGRDYDADVRGVIGRRIDEMLPSLQTVVRDRPFAVVVNLGTNDALQARTHPDWQPGFARMIDLLAPQRCVIVTTINTLVIGQVGAPGVAAAINDAIGTAVATHRNLHVVDWNAAVHEQDPSPLLTPDRIHPSNEGRLVLAALLRTAVDHDCRPARAQPLAITSGSGRRCLTPGSAGSAAPCRARSTTSCPRRPAGRCR